MTNEISAGIIIYRKTEEGPKFLLLYYGGRYWGFPKGKLAQNERSFKAALREVWEETGLGNRDLVFADWFKVEDRYIFTKSRKKVFKKVSYYLAETKNPRVCISKEHQGYGWFLYPDAAKILLYQNMRKNLKKVYDIIAKKEKRKEDRSRKTEGL